MPFDKVGLGEAGEVGERDLVNELPAKIGAEILMELLIVEVSECSMLASTTCRHLRIAKLEEAGCEM